MLCIVIISLFCLINLIIINSFFRETNESNLLLKEKAESLQNKLQRADQRITELTRVEIENEVCEQVHKVQPTQMVFSHVTCKLLTVCFLKLIKHRIGIKKGWFLYKINQRTLRNAQRSRNAYTVEPHVTKIQNLLTLVRGEHCYQLAEYLTFKQFFVKVWV